MIKVYSAKKIITMDHNWPIVTHVAVRNGYILAVGDEKCADGWGEAVLVDRFKDSVLLPGFIEAHAHVSAGGVWRYTYCGHYNRIDPDGKEWSGLKTYDALIDQLKIQAEMLPPGQPVVGWGFDPNFLKGSRLNRHHLDEVSKVHPVVVMQSNFHVLTANTLALQNSHLLNGSNTEGVLTGEDGLANGELHEFKAMRPVMEKANVSIKDLSDETALKNYGKIAQLCGVTTAADLLSDLDLTEVVMLESVTGQVNFPIRYVPMMNAMENDPNIEAKRALALRSRSTDKLHLGRAKLFTDGAIQAGTAKLKEPGYFKIKDQGIWNMEVSHFKNAVQVLHAAGVKTHIHCNGDLASELAISAYEDAILGSSNPDLRHTLEHVQLADISQFRRMRALGLTANIFANHLYYFGDIHWTKSIGPERAKRMDACQDALEIFDGCFAIHSDAPVTPMAPLFTAWCAVNRTTQSGRDLGNSQKIAVADALHAITMGAAFVLKMDDQIGSISPGKRADFVILGEDPTNVKPQELKDISVIGTILGGMLTN